MEGRENKETKEEIRKEKEKWRRKKKEEKNSRFAF